MGTRLDSLVRSTSTLTACRVECPECGHVAPAAWTREEDVCKCRACGARFCFSENTYRPLTKGMTEEERRRFYRRNDKKVSELDPSEVERLREANRIRNARYRERHHEEIKARARERWRKTHGYYERRGRDV